jgi:hypothetical protein
MVCSLGNLHVLDKFVVDASRTRFTQPPALRTRGMSRFASASLISPIEFAAGNAYSRSKTGLEPKEGDEDLIDYYYLVLNPNCNTARDLRGSDGKRFLHEVLPRLKTRFGDENVQHPFWFPRPKVDQ